ncbi:haloacid dehalogenase-like hydrolase [Seminavis robusta]|uniref:Haloacid dehalogenase-like hydrolase n=1 Tax=Seminavis robusta TaxID=568900 RepID=A0A9N8E9M1_9STRA|nr:haloacid dehalogenase-like hydrolase [Seminavis robusta]|eukprot:Sro849_g210520.1 haloacid dehalogenase-like hydrolase (253) ;mRNA; r:12643-13401
MSNNVNNHTDQPSSSSSGPFDLLLFDLDGTLYDHACGYEDHIHANIFKFMVEAKGGKFDAIHSIEQAQQVWTPIFAKYNLTKRGLMGEGYEFDGTAYDTFIRKGAAQFIQQPDPELRSFLQSLPQRKIIFTNAPETSAHEILQLLGVADQFEAVLGSDFMGNDVCKPERAAFDKVLEFLQPPVVVPPHRICYFEDSFKNLLAGKELGMATVFVTSATLHKEGRTQEDLAQFDAVVERKVGASLRESMPRLWN